MKLESSKNTHSNEKVKSTMKDDDNHNENYDYYDNNNADNGDAMENNSNSNRDNEEVGSERMSST